jgi:hypothetical protein
MQTKDDLELEIMLLERKHAKGKISREDYLYKKSELLGQRTKPQKQRLTKRAPKSKVEFTEKRIGVLLLFSLAVISIITYTYCFLVGM